MPGIHPKEQEQPSQPVPQGLDTATLYGLDVGGTIQPQNMYVRSDDRHLQRTYPIVEELEEDPTKRQCPAGGCPNNNDLYKDIYGDLFQKEVAKAPTVNLQDKAQLREVHMRVVDILRPRVRENRKYLKQDKEGPSVAEGPEFTMKDGGVYYPRFRKSLQQMYEDQKRLRHHEYDSLEHETMTLMEKALVNGAKRVSHVSHNKDTNGNEAIRDQITMVWDEKEQRGQMIIENIAQDGKFFTLEEAREVMQKRLSEVAEVHPVDGVFIFTDKPLAREETQRSVTPYDVTDVSIGEPYRAEADYEPVGEPVHVSREDHSGDRSVHDTIAEERARMSNDIVGDTIRTAEYVRRSLQQEFKLLTTSFRLYADQEVQKKLIVLPPFLQRLLGIFEEREQREEGIKKIESHEERESEIFNWQSQESPEALQKIWEEMRGAQEVIAFAVDPETEGVAIPAAIFVLDILAHPEKILVEDTQEIGEEDRVVPLTEKEREAVIAFITSDDKEIPPVESTQETVTVLNIEHIDMTVLTWVKELIYRIDLEPVEKATETIEHEGEVTLIKMSELWETVLKMRRMNFATTNRNSRIHSAPVKEDAYLENIEHEHVEHASFALTVWVLLKLNGYYRSLRSLKTFFMGETKQVSIVEKLKERMPEGLVQREPASWILLAIIWHLAMIRESCGAGSRSARQGKQPVIRKTKTKKKLQTPYIPRGGVIFAFVS